MAAAAVSGSQGFQEAAGVSRFSESLYYVRPDLRRLYN